jgi:hypothetical protein
MIVRIKTFTWRIFGPLESFGKEMLRKVKILVHIGKPEYYVKLGSEYFLCILPSNVAMLRS